MVISIYTNKEISDLEVSDLTNFAASINMATAKISDTSIVLRSPTLYDPAKATCWETIKVDSVQEFLDYQLVKAA
jgi:hypothetical protein